ncbi:MAG: aminoacyl-tRNA hydrolase, partial [Blastocatellia bacterium]|nr:aminoacyl-tRNA hydrolase [Blastocatellia bacterium]
LGTQEFIRLRIGVLPEHPVSNLKTFVLSDFPPNERDTVRSVTERSAKAIEAIVRDGVERAMAQFNSEAPKE